MAIKVKKGGVYTDPVGIFAKKAGVYSAVQGVSAKVAGAYVSVTASQVDVLRKMTAISAPYLKRISSTVIELGSIANVTHAAAFRMRLDGDGLLIMGGGFANPKAVQTVGVEALNLTGTFTTSTNNPTANWASVAGSYFDLDFTGVALDFKYYTDNRGGIMKLETPGQDPVLLSTWAAVGAAKQSTIFSGLTDGPHTCRVTYMGADPLNPPTGGVARGWFQYLSVGGFATGVATLGVQVMNPTSPIAMIASNSNTELAMNVTPVGSGLMGKWFPTHDAELGASRNIARDIKVNGASIGGDIGVISTLGVAINSCDIAQTFRAYNALDVPGNYPVADVALAHRYADGLLSVGTGITTLVDALWTGYFLMQPTTVGSSDLALFDDGSRFVPAAVNQSRSAASRSKSGLVRNATTLVGAAAAGASSEMLLGPGFASRLDAVFLEDRTNGISKQYWKRFDNELIPAGSTFQCQTQYFLTANAPGVAAL